MTRTQIRYRGEALSVVSGHYDTYTNPLQMIIVINILESHPQTAIHSILGNILELLGFSRRQKVIISGKQQEVKRKRGANEESSTIVSATLFVTHKLIS
jgi:hypothetical protein